MALRVSLADYYQHIGEHEKAIATYRLVLDREPSNIVALNNLAWTFAADSQRARDGLSLVQKAIDLAGPIGDLLDTRSRLLAEIGDSQAAVRDLIEAVSETPTAQRLMDLAALHRKVGQPDLAERVERRARRYGGQELGVRN